MSWSQTDLTPYKTQLSIAADQSALLLLEQLAILNVSGADAADFLHNLFTNDVKSLQEGESRLCGFCNPKGRLFTIVLVTKQGDSFNLILPSDLLDFIKARLSLFVLRSQVVINAIEQCVVALANANLELFSTSSLAASPMPSLSELSLACVETNQIPSLIETAQSQNYQIATDNAWQVLLIEAGLAQVFKGSSEAFTPQQINLDLVDGVSFSKGCYPGQEVVARLHYLGSPSRRLFKAQIKATQLPAVNSDVLSAEGQVLGQVVMSAYLEQDTIVVQLSMKLADIDQAATIDGVKVEKLQRYIDEAEA